MDKEELEKRELKEQIELLKQEIENKQVLLENLLNQLDDIKEAKDEN